MSDRPCPRSIAICALIALQSDPSSPLHEVDFDPSGLTTFLEKSVLEIDVAEEDLRSLITNVRFRIGDEVTTVWLDTLTMASESVDSLVELMESLRNVVSVGLVDSVSAHGVFIRKICLGFEELAFESVAYLWQAFCGSLASTETNEGAESNLCLSQNIQSTTSQMEQVFRLECVAFIQGANGSDQTFEDIEMRIMETLERNPELSTAYFLRYLNCLAHGERSGAIEALHQYFDHVMVRNTFPTEILQFSAILQAITHNCFGNNGLALMATEEAVRVAQQSKDASCVAFALGWLFTSQGQGATERSELLSRCATRATQGQLRSLETGANLALAKHFLEGASRKPSAAWARLIQMSSEHWSNNPTNLDRPAYMSTAPMEAMEIFARQQVISAGIWDALGLPALSGLASLAAMHSRSDLVFADVLTAVQNISRLELYGAPSNFLSNPEHLSESEPGTCVYDRAIRSLVALRREGIGEKSRFNESLNQDVSLLLYEWAVNRGEVKDAMALGHVLESGLHRGMANHSRFQVDRILQRCIFIGRQGKWEEARSELKWLISDCERRELTKIRTMILLRLSILELEANRKDVVSAVSALLEALNLSEKLEMHELHGASLAVLAKICLRLRNPKRSLAILRGTIPLLVQREHVWFQADAYLTKGQSCLQIHRLSRSASKTYLTKALNWLNKSQSLFEECEDAFRLRDVSYLQARIYSELGEPSKRESVSKRFVNLCQQLESGSKLSSITRGPFVGQTRFKV